MGGFEKKYKNSLSVTTNELYNNNVGTLQVNQWQESKDLSLWECSNTGFFFYWYQYCVIEDAFVSSLWWGHAVGMMPLITINVSSSFYCQADWSVFKAAFFCWNLLFSPLFSQSGIITDIAFLLWARGQLQSDNVASCHCANNWEF